MVAAVAEEVAVGGGGRHEEDAVAAEQSCKPLEWAGAWETEAVARSRQQEVECH